MKLINGIDVEKLQNIIKECDSKAEVLKRLNLVAKGGNYATLNNLIKKFNLDISHFKGQGWRKNKQGTDNVSYSKLDDILQNKVSCSSSRLLKRLIANSLKEYRCENCGISEWNGKPINLEIHHVDGNHYNNSLDNLQILCPNCHSQTSNYRGKNRKTKLDETKGFKQFYNKELPTCICKNCGKEFKGDRYDRIRQFCCRACYNDYLKNNGNLNSCKKYNKFTLDELKEQCNICETISQIARNLGTHRCTIREYLIKYNLYDEFMNKNN